MENQTVINICGAYPENFSKQDIANTPDFVFKNDPSYSTIRLYDIDENTVFLLTHLLSVNIMLLVVGTITLLRI